MATDRIDPEDIAALLDGTLSAAERDRVVAALARSDDAYEDFLEAAAIQKELAAPSEKSATSGESETTHPLTSARWRTRGMFGIVIGLVAATLLITVVMQRRRDDSDARMLAVVATAIGNTAGSGNIVTTFGPEWNSPGWSDVRGGDGGTAELSAFRAGARFTELRAAEAAQDTTAFASARQSLVAIVRNLDAGVLVAQSLEKIQSSAQSTALSSAAEHLRGLGKSPIWFDIGAWAEAARLAAIAGRMDFFARDGAAVAELRRIENDASKLSPEDRTLVDGIVAPLHYFITTDAIDLTIARVKIDSALKAAR